MDNESKIEHIFKLAAEKYSDSNYIHTLWQEIVAQYSESNRFYHTLGHLENLYAQLLQVRENITDWDAIVFATVFHDYIYDTARTDNEEQSADIAHKRLESIGVPEDRIQRACAHILATKGHTTSNDRDTNAFTDSDLSILGQRWESYLEYSGQIRHEYSRYSDAEYNAGRKKVLTHFLTMERLFKTSYFYQQYEHQARENIAREIRSLEVE